MNEQYYYPMYQPNGYRPMQPQPQQQAQNGLTWVTGMEGAKSFLVAPNNTVMLMDSEAQRFYIKSADQSGMPLPMRVFNYSEVTEAQAQPVTVQSADTSKFITREEFEQRIATLGAGGTSNG